MKRGIFVLVLLIIAALGFYKISNKKSGEIKKSQNYDAAVETYKTDTLSRNESKPVAVKLADKSLGDFYKAYMDENLNILVEEDFFEEVMACSVFRYKDGRIRIDKGNISIIMNLDKNGYTVDKASHESKGNPTLVDDILYIPADGLSDYLDYKCEYDYIENSINFVRGNIQTSLPEKYDLREMGRVTPVRDQGRYGTCWAFASLGALETTLMPLQENIYSTEHMTLNNSYNLNLSTGGEHTVSIAYLAAWQGPVYEEDDRYGDGYTNKSLKAVKHLEEAIIIKNRNDDTIKRAIFRYGGVETSLYLQMSYTGDYSEFYNEETAAYYYNGDKASNHDIVIVGWDDNYPRENFRSMPEKNGAYICKNSWGNEFGEDGFFYVSYEDVNICSQSIVYTKLMGDDNFDNIYQSDLMGWVGQIGFGSDSGYFSNVYTAKKDEKLSAVSFYTTDDDTKFSVYVVHDFESDKSFDNKYLIASGEMRYSGYYTVRVEDKVNLKAGEKFAVVVNIITPNSTKPIAIEYRADDRTNMADITDGEGYISLYGDVWHSAETGQKCNVCLKAFTDDIDGDAETEASPEETGENAGEKSGDEAGVNAGEKSGDEAGVDAGEKSGDEAGVNAGEKSGVNTDE